MQSKTRYSDEQVMLTLSMLSYGGVPDIGGGLLDDLLQRVALEDLLRSVDPVRDWDVVWGPATHRSLFALFADSAMFVARDRNEPSRYAVVIRGTNPFSAFDWIFGDAWTGRVAPWRYAPSPGAALSYSSTLGLDILRNMRSIPLPARPEAPWDALRDGLVDTAEAANKVLSPLRHGLSQAVRRTRSGILRDMEKLSDEFDLEPRADLDTRLAALASLHRSPVRERVLGRVDGALRDTSGRAQVDLLHLLEGINWLESRFQLGESLQRFLAHAARRAERRGEPPLDVFVTGHSKGGALAPVVAQWLSDTQGRSHPSGESWDDSSQSRVHCYAFAGPTPGNRAFAHLYEDTLGERGHRISNRYDVVTHSWAVPSPGWDPELNIRQVPDLYGSAVHWHGDQHERLKEINGWLADEVRHLAYAHVGADATVFSGKLDPDSQDFLVHVLRQHTIAYLDQAGVSGLLPKLGSIS